MFAVSLFHFHPHLLSSHTLPQHQYPRLFHLGILRLHPLTDLDITLTATLNIPHCSRLALLHKAALLSSWAIIHPSIPIHPDHAAKPTFNTPPLASSSRPWNPDRDTNPAVALCFAPLPVLPPFSLRQNGRRKRVRQSAPITHTHSLFHSLSRGIHPLFPAHTRVQRALQAARCVSSVSILSGIW